MDVQPRHHRGEAFARLVHLSSSDMSRAAPWCGRQRGGARLRHRVAQHARSDRVALGVVVSRRLSGDVPLTTWASFHPRFTASCTPMLRPCPPTGGCTCAASPADAASGHPRRLRPRRAKASWLCEEARRYHRPRPRTRRPPLAHCRVNARIASGRPGTRTRQLQVLKPDRWPLRGLPAAA